jgi:hypothetical protein
MSDNGISCNALNSPIVARIKRGESLPIDYNRAGESIIGWVCTMIIKKFPPDGNNDYGFAPREILPDVAAGEFPALLTSSDTKALTENGAYEVIGLLTNADTDENEQPTVRINMGQAWATI